MERPLALLLAIVLAFGASQPVTADSRTDSGPSTGFSVFHENGKVGLKDAQGRILIPAAYEAIGWSDGRLSVIDRVVGYQKEGSWGLITTSNKVLTTPEYIHLKPGEGSYLIGQKRSLSQRPSFGVLNTSGKVIIPFIYDALEIANMRVIVMSRTGSRYLFGLTDLSHKILIPLNYQRIYSLGSLRYGVEDFNGKTAIYSEDGVRLTDFSIDSIAQFEKDKAVVYENRRQGIMDRNGRMVVEAMYGEVRITPDGSIMVREPHEWYLLRGDNTLLRKVNADGINALSNDHYSVFSGGVFQLTNNDFSGLHPDFFSFLGDFRNGMAVFRKDGHSGVISERGEVLIPAQYYALEQEEDGFRAVLGPGGRNRWVLLDLKGNQKTDRQYEVIGAFNGKFYPVKNRGYWGAVNTAGEEIITCVHDSLLQVSGDKVAVKFKGEFGVVDLREHWIVTPQPNPIKLLNEEAYLETNDTTTFLKSYSGDLIYFSNNPVEYANGYLHETLPSGVSWVIDMNGVIVDRSNESGHVERIYEESEGYRAIRKDGKFGFIDDRGRLRVANRYEAVQPFKSGLAGIRIRGKWGFIDRSEKLVVQPVYDEVENFSNGLAIVRQSNLWGLIDRNGKPILPLRYDEITRNAHGRYVIRSGQSMGLVDAAGMVIVQPRYHGLSDPGNGYVIVQRDEKFGVVGVDGVSTIPMIYDGLTHDPYRDHFIAVKKSALRELRK